VSSQNEFVTDKLIAPDVFERLQQAMASRPMEFVELCRDYLTEARRNLVEMRSAFASKQAAELRERAHYLKGSSLIMGAVGMTRCCADLEAMGKNGDFSQTERMLDQTSATLDAVEAEFVKRLGPN
jgi:HPt (histidine-containing phosphotransfer) domain-containing protein